VPPSRPSASMVPSTIYRKPGLQPVWETLMEGVLTGHPSRGSADILSAATGCSPARGLPHRPAHGFYGIGSSPGPWPQRTQADLKERT
jgi:hypothetical protein